MLGDGRSGLGRSLKPMNETTDATAIFAPLWKRKWLILAIAILVGVGSYVYYKHQPSVYSATTQVYLGNGNEEQAQIGASGNGAKRATPPNPATQAALINSNIIREAVRARLRRERRSHAVRTALKGKTKAASTEKSEFITINGEAPSARGAALLVNTTAQTYVKRQNAHYRAEVETAIALARRQIHRLEASQTPPASTSTSKGKTTVKSGASNTTATIQSATLSTKINQLESDLAIAEVAQVNPAKPINSILLSPHPRSNALFGFAIGLLLAAFGAYGLDRLDRRMRSLGAIEEIFQTQVLTALRAVRRPLLVNRDGHPTPAYVLREALWRLQTTLQVGNNAAGNGAATTANGGGRGPRTILCVSADPGDGKSTLIAALALAWGEAGERVAVVEADFRRPVQSRFLNVSGSYGLADVLTGMLPLEQALQSVSLMRPDAAVSSPSSPPPIPVPASAPAHTPAGSTATVVASAGSVSLLAGGTKVANPPALLGHPAAGELVRSLARDFDHVLLDAPSPLQVSDVLPLLAAVDGIVIVARVGHTRASAAERLVQLLQRTPSAPVLGVVANAVSQADIKKYGVYADGGRQKRGLSNLIGR
jgi:Mrp family chromosome partitioning ATPase/capsular polysaccharide biosynthesis protein